MEPKAKRAKKTQLKFYKHYSTDLSVRPLKIDRSIGKQKQKLNSLREQKNARQY